jgi:hypothetical protein
MPSLLRVLRDRIAPVALTAAGVAMLAAGLLHYGDAAQAGPLANHPSPSDTAALPTPTFLVPSLPPINGSAPPIVTAGPNLKRLATRIVIDQLGIDLPVIRQPNDNYPYCNVAMILNAPGLVPPGNGGSVYLYAHARTGMFGPLYERAILGRSGGARSLKSMLVRVYTSDDFMFEYEITRVLPHVKADSHFLDGPLAVKSETLWLQTSTGPNATYPKLQVIAKPFYVQAVPHAAAHPKAHPVTCG